jgi:DNA (cytosine-5)-methyltransferase 1
MMLPPLHYLSVCSGIEAATCAWHPLGWQAVAYSEIEPFPAHVLHHHYGSGRPWFMPDSDAPDLSAKDRKGRIAAVKAVAALPERATLFDANGASATRAGTPNFGDMTQFERWPDATVDVLVGGTPCQSFSVAGLRKGLGDARGNLMLTYLAIAARYRPSWLVWENVPGALSVEGGGAFAALIGGMAELGYHAAWRVLDAQFVRVDGFGRAVPQRRRRVFVVGYLGDWRRAAAVLFERESLCGDSAPRRQARQGIAGTLSARAGGGGRPDGGDGRHDQLIASPCLAGGHSQNPLDEKLVAHALRAEGFDASEDGTGRGTPLVPVIAPSVASSLTRGAESGGKGGYAGRRQEDDANIVATKGHNCHWNGGPHPPLSQSSQTRAGGIGASNQELFEQGGAGLVPDGWAVRRLIPVECERLQGFRDGYTAIDWRGKPAADGPRYKALGNSMAVNVMRWLGRRIDLVRGIA